MYSKICIQIVYLSIFFPNELSTRLYLPIYLFGTAKNKDTILVKSNLEL